MRQLLTWLDLAFVLARQARATATRCRRSAGLGAWPLRRLRACVCVLIRKAASVRSVKHLDVGSGSACEQHRGDQPARMLPLKVAGGTATVHGDLPSATSCRPPTSAFQPLTPLLPARSQTRANIDYRLHCRRSRSHFHFLQILLHSAASPSRRHYVDGIDQGAAWYCAGDFVRPTRSAPPTTWQRPP